MTDFPKKGEVRLDSAAYWKLKMSVHEADGWKCRVCLKITGLTLHHLTKRSELRLDVSENLISVCVPCHNRIESGQIEIVMIDPAFRAIRVIILPQGEGERC